MPQRNHDSPASGVSFITKLILGKLVLIAVVAVIIYFSLRNV